MNFTEVGQVRCTLVAYMPSAFIRLKTLCIFGAEKNSSINVTFCTNSNDLDSGYQISVRATECEIPVARRATSQKSFS